MFESIANRIKTEEKNVWLRYVIGPGSVRRPVPRCAGGLFYFFAQNNPPLDEIWSQIVDLTREGRLGYYAGYSNNSQLIAIHHSMANDINEMDAIEEELREIGVNYWFYKTKRAARNCHQEQIVRTLPANFDLIINYNFYQIIDY